MRPCLTFEKSERPGDSPLLVFDDFLKKSLSRTKKYLEPSSCTWWVKFLFFVREKLVFKKPCLTPDGRHSVRRHRKFGVVPSSADIYWPHGCVAILSRGSSMSPGTERAHSWASCFSDVFRLRSRLLSRPIEPSTCNICVDFIQTRKGYFAGRTCRAAAKRTRPGH